MKVVQINVTCGLGSTGKICLEISRYLSRRGVENYIFYASGSGGYPLGRKYMCEAEGKLQALKARLAGNYGFQSAAATRRLVAALEKIQPDIVHLHNLHGHNCDLQTLFSYLKEKRVRLFWTFHDCWAFTGYCPHYDMAGCGKWKESCGGCPQKRQFSWVWDRSRKLLDWKKQLLSGLNLTIVAPSRWMAGQVGKSFLREYPVRVIHNGIDLEIFQPRRSRFREIHGCEGNKLILGVAFGWDQRKGLDVFLELARRLDPVYKIVLVGTDRRVDRQLPPNIISVHRTYNQMELAETYSAADVFVNPTREENFPTVNLEALACGTPVVTFRTGGSGEMLEEDCGCVVEKEDMEGLIAAIHRLSGEKPYRHETCVQRAKAFSKRIMQEAYAALYEP